MTHPITLTSHDLRVLRDGAHSGGVIFRVLVAFLALAFLGFLAVTAVSIQYSAQYDISFAPAAYFLTSAAVIAALLVWTFKRQRAINRQADAILRAALTKQPFTFTVPAGTPVTPVFGRGLIVDDGGQAKIVRAQVDKTGASGVLTLTTSPLNEGPVPLT